MVSIHAFSVKQFMMYTYVANMFITIGYNFHECFGVLLVLLEKILDTREKKAHNILVRNTHRVIDQTSVMQYQFITRDAHHNSLK